MPGMPLGSDANERQAKAFGTAVLGRAKVVFLDECHFCRMAVPATGGSRQERQVPKHEAY